MKWFRFYAEVLHKPKVQRLPAQLFKDWVNMLCLAAETDGNIDPDPANLAYSLHVTPARAKAIIQELHDAKLLDRTETGLTPHNWNERQFVSDVSTDRVRKFRQAKRNVSGNGTALVSCNGKVTASETAPDTDTESDTESEPPLPPIAETPNLGELFEACWGRWPAKGRTHKTLCQQYWVQILGHLSPEDKIYRLGEIHAGIDKWLSSLNFSKGYVHKFADFLANGRWAEEPEQVSTEPPMSELERRIRNA